MIITYYLLLCDCIFHQLVSLHLQENNTQVNSPVKAEMDNHDSLKVSSFSLHSWTALEWHFIMLLETSRNRSYWRCNSAMWCCHKHSESSNFLHLPIYTPLSEQFLTLQTYKHKFFPMYRKKFMFMFLCLYVYVYLPGYVCSGILFNAWRIICDDKGLH